MLFCIRGYSGIKRGIFIGRIEDNVWGIYFEKYF